MRELAWWEALPLAVAYVAGLGAALALVGAVGAHLVRRLRGARAAAAGSSPGSSQGPSPAAARR